MRSEHPRVWVGIDAGKEFHWAHLLDASGTELLSCRVENHEAELVALIEEILSLAEDMVWETDQPGGSAALLVGGRTAVPRHRTLSGAFDWSHDLLGEPERKLFRRLSTFSGGFTLEAAETVGPGDGVGKDYIFELLSGLVDQSLVVTETTDDKALRYGMLEPVRQYAREKLEGSGEAEAVRRRHAVFFLALAEEAEPGLLGSDEAAWLDRLTAEHDNMRAAHSWAIESGEPELGLRLAGALRMFWYERGHYGEGRGRLEQALAKDGRAVVRSKWLVTSRLLSALCGSPTWSLHVLG